MSSVRQAVVDTLKTGSHSAVDLHAKLRLLGFKDDVEALYVDLVAMEALEQVCAEPRQVGTKNTYVWALGRALTPRAPDFQPVTRMVDDLLRQFGTPTDWSSTEPPPVGVLVHRIR